MNSMNIRLLIGQGSNTIAVERALVSMHQE